MKKNISINALAVSILVGIVVISAVSQVIINSSKDKLTLQSVASKSQYTKGEIVEVLTTIQNKTASEIYLNGIDVKSGYLKILVSSDGNNFKSYLPPNYGDKKTKGRVLKQGESVTSSAKMLFNTVPDIKGLSDYAIQNFDKERVMTMSVFPESGAYYIKTTLSVSDKNRIKEIESEPIKITITEPVGEDLEVWNKIKDNGNFAYFIQEGDMLIPSYKPEERAKFQAEVEQILTDYPNSFYAASLSQSLTKFKASEAKRCELMEKIKPKP